MKKVKYFALAILLAGSFTMTSCSDDDVATTQVNMGLNIKNTIGDNLKVETGTYTFANVSTGTETTIDYGATLTRAATESTLATLTDGLYNVTFSRLSLESSSHNLRSFRHWHILPEEYRYCRRASRHELRDYISGLIYNECHTRLST